MPCNPPFDSAPRTCWVHIFANPTRYRSTKVALVRANFCIVKTSLIIRVFPVFFCTCGRVQLHCYALDDTALTWLCVSGKATFFSFFFKQLTNHWLWHRHQTTTVSFLVKLPFQMLFSREHCETNSIMNPKDKRVRPFVWMCFTCREWLQRGH